MPLIRNAEQTEDRYLRIADEETVPDEGGALSPAARFLADANRALARSGATGVIWPNDRDVSELAPYLDRLALVALVFPTFKDGRAYSQARTLRERYRFRGELRATGEVLRDQFLFLHRAGFDSFEVKKPEDAQAFCEALQRYNVFYQPAADGDVSALRRRLIPASRQRDAAAEPCLMTPLETPSDRTARLNKALLSASPAAVIEKAIEVVPAGRLAIVSSFGIESAVLLKYAADVDPGLPVLFLDTGMLFEETLDYRDRLVDFFGLTDVRSLKPQIELLERRDPSRDLWLRDTESCCHIRKVRPLSDALGGFDGWMNGRKRFHGGARADIAHVESDGRLLKFNPLAALTRSDIEAVFEAEGLPRHPLEKMGFSSVGCVPCTSRTRKGEAPRAGRWRNQNRTECGIHRIGLPAGAGCGC